MRTSRVAATLGVLFFAAGAAAEESAEFVMLRVGESVRLAVEPGDGRRVVALAGIEGATLDIQAAARARSRVVPYLTLVGPGGRVIDLGGANGSGGRRARVRGFSLPETGVWRIGVATSSSQGGDVVLSVGGKWPSRFAWSDASERPISATHEFAAAPGDRVRVTLRRTAGAGGPATLSLLGPDGSLVARAEGAAGRLRLDAPALASLGSLRLRVESGPGAVTTQVTVRAARRGRPDFEDVEAPPELFGFTPGTLENQSKLTVRLEGVEFAGRQVVSLRDGDRVLASGPLQLLGGSVASALLDLEDAAPGTYTLLVTTPGGNGVAAPEPVVLRNRPPSIVLVTPADAPNAEPFLVEVAGGGFDAEATLRVRRRTDGALVPVVVTKRTRAERIEGLVSPAEHFTGLCDVEVTDPDGARDSSPMDVLGQRAAPVGFRSLEGAPPLDLTLLDAAWDSSRGRVLAAAREGLDRAVMTLLDGNGFAALDAVAIGAEELNASSLQHVRVAYDAIGDAFAIAVTSASDPPAARVRVVDAADLARTLGTFDVPAEDLLYLTRLSVTADRVRGGFLAVWDRHDATWGARLLAQPIASDGTVDPARAAVLAWSPADALAYPAAVARPDGAFVVAWAGTTGDGLSYAIHATVLDADLRQIPGAGPHMTASSRSWSFAAVPDLAANPDDGSTALTFAFGEGVLLRPASQRLAPGTGYPGTWHPLDAGLRFDGGQPGGIVWDPARREFVATVVGHDRRVSVRRIGKDGAVRASVVESYEGLSALPVAGPLAGSLGLLRGFDGIADGRQDPEARAVHLVAAPLR